MTPTLGSALAYPDVDKPSCQLLGPTALVVQGLMGVFVVLSLVYKRHRETPKRPWRIWLFDVSKQVVGQLFVHSANLLVSGFASHNTSKNACVSYFLNILIDTTFGVALIYVTLHALTNLFAEKLHLKGFESGVYGEPPSFRYWIRQAALYILSLSTMKVIVVTFLFLFPGIYLVGEWLLSWTWKGEEDDDLQVVFVMGIFPILMNVLQFWLIDSIVKASSVAAVALDVEHDAYQDRQPLFHAGSDDEGDEQPSRALNVNRRDSQTSYDSREHHSHDLSFATGTGMTTPDEGKSPAGPSNEDDSHSYPPSLSSSLSDAQSTHNLKAPRVAKNLMKKPKRNDAPLHSSRSNPPGSSSLPQTPPPPAAVPASVATENLDWADTWDDAVEWDHQKQNSLSIGGEWNNTHESIRSDS